MRAITQRTRVGLLPIAVLLSAIALSACGSSGGKASGGGSSGGSSTTASVSGISDPVARAATVSNSTGGYKMDFTMSIKSPQLPSAMTATGSGSFSSTSRSGQLNMSMDFGSGSGLSQELGSNTLDMQEIIDGTIVYVKLPPALMSKLPGGKEWLSLDLSKLGSAAGVPGLGSLFSNPTSSNPAEMLQYLRAVSGGVTKVGTATVNGYQTTEYKATIDFAKYPSIVPAAQRAAARQAIASLEKLAKVQDFPVEVWIDNNNLVRRMQFAFNETVASAGALQTDMTMNMTGYGTQPAPSIPAAGDVMSLNSLLGAAGAALANG